MISGVLSGCAAGPAAAPSAASSAAVVPGAPVRTLDGVATRVPDMVRGRVALVSLWATWCEPCLTEFPALLRFAERAPEAGAVGVTVAIGESPAHVSGFVRERGLHNPALVQLVDEQFQFADAVGQRRVPATLVVDRSGRIVFTGGALDEAALTAVRSALQTP